MGTLKIENGHIFCMDTNRTSIKKGSIFVKDNVITEIGLSKNLKKLYADKTIDADNHLILPGFVNTHTHLHQYNRGIYELIGGLYRMEIPLEKYRSPDQMDKMAESLCAEFIWGGSTTVHVIYTYPEGFAKCVEKSGLRAILSADIEQIDLDAIKKGEYKYNKEKGLEALSRAKDLFFSWNGKAEGRIKIYMTPKGVDFVTGDILKEIKSFSERHNIRITTHLSQSYREVNQSYKIYNLSPTHVLDKFGILSDNLSVAHFAFADEIDTQLLAKRGVGISQCRFINSPIQKWLDHGINVGLGTDDDYHNMIELMKELTIGQQNRAYSVRGSEGIEPENPVFLKPKPYELLEMATRKGAEILGIHKETGSLEIGKKADIITFDLNSPHIAPTFDPIVSLVYYGNSSDVNNVIIDGKIVKENGELVTINRIKASQDAYVQAKEMMEAFFHDHKEEEKLLNQFTDYLKKDSEE